jgi:regulator of protease activity HflC (stomatin/prohibitin superfamily)
MKRILMFLVMLPLMGSMSSCSFDDVPEQHRGLAIVHPFLFGSDHVEMLLPGMHTIAWTTQLENVSVTPYTISENFDDMRTKDDELVDFSVHLNFKHEDKGLTDLYSGFGMEWYKNNVKEPFRTSVRNLCKKYTQEQLTSNPDISVEIAELLRKEVLKMLITKTIPSVNLLGVEVGKVNPPAEVTAQITQTAVQKYRKDTEDAKGIAEESRMEAERKRAEADGIYRRTMGFSNAEYLTDKKIQNEKDIVELSKKNPNMKFLITIGGNGVVPTTPFQ